MINTIKGAIFDLDGTLINSLIIWDVMWEKFGQMFLGKNGFRPTQKDDKAIRTMTLVEATEYINGIYHFSDDSGKVLEAANKIIEDFYANEVESKDGVKGFLEELLQKGVKMCVASATDLRLVKIAIEHCGLGKYFSEVLSCADIGKGKDKPDIYLLAMQKLGTSLEETCVFEDSHVAIETAHSIGMKTVGIYDDYNYGQDEIKKTANAYIAKGETLLKLLDK